MLTPVTAHRHGRTGLQVRARRFTARAGQLAARETGQATVEFALVAGVFLLIVFGITQFGLALNTANDETDLASVTARYAAVNYNPSTSGQSLQNWAKAQADTAMLASGGQVCINTFGAVPTGYVKVTVSTNFNWQPLSALSRLFGGAFPSSSSITGSAVMRLEGNPSAYSTGCSS
jgi:Flp pilus assembly protein TadG